jgi:hypothetical protein
MLIAERIRSERLVQILKDMQRHRFGRRAETLSADQLLLALEDVEQSEAETAAEAEAKSQATRAEGARKRRANRGALPPHLPRIETDRRRREPGLPVLSRRTAPDRRRRQREARRRPGTVPGSRRAAAQVRLSRLRGRGDPSPSAGAADRGRLADRGDGRPCAGRQIRRPPAALSPGADLRASGNPARSLDARRLGRPRRLPPAADPRTHPRQPALFRETVRRRDDGAGARSRPRTHQDRATLGLRQRRSPLGRNRPAGGRLCLCARPDGVAADRASFRLQGRSPGRRLRRLPRARPEGRRQPRLLPSRRGCHHPRPSQTRTSGLPASGSSRASFAQEAP